MRLYFVDEINCELLTFFYSLEMFSSLTKRVATHVYKQMSTDSNKIPIMHGCFKSFLYGYTTGLGGCWLGIWAYYKNKNLK